MKQVFIFSLPRSGSTLLQRTLMAHEKIASSAEPWLLLPQVYALRSQGQLSEYGSLPASRGINDLIENLPNKKADYYEAIRGFTDHIHSKMASNGEVYFLDKTPRYFYIIDELAEIFPEAKFIFLFRRPEQIYSSMIVTWGNNSFRSFLSSYHDLVDGFPKLSEGFEKHKSRSIAVNYEDFVKNPEAELRQIMTYLDLDYRDELTTDFSDQETKGRLGDPTGVKAYNSISTQTLDKWKATFNTRFRKHMAKKMIKKIDRTALEVQGFDKDAILKDIKGIKAKTFSLSLLPDYMDYLRDSLIRKLNLQLRYNKEFSWSKRKYLS